MGKAQEVCEECKLHDAIYRCPGCNCKTCSLQCSKRHKTHLNCNGKLDKSQFVKKYLIDENVLNRDYQLLSEVERTLDNSVRTRKLSYETQNLNHQLLRETDVNRKRQLLARIAKKKLNVNVLVPPRGLRSTSINQSHWNKNQNKFFWTIKWLIFESLKNNIREGHLHVTSSGEFTDLNSVGNNSEHTILTEGTCTILDALKILIDQTSKQRDTSSDSSLRASPENLATDQSSSILKDVGLIALDSSISTLHLQNIANLLEFSIKTYSSGTKRSKIVDPLASIDDVLRGESVYEILEISVRLKYSKSVPKISDLDSATQFNTKVQNNFENLKVIRNRLTRLEYESDD